MIMMHQVAKLVDDHVFDTGFGRFDQLRIEDDFAFGGATAPAKRHILQVQARRRDPVGRKPLNPRFSKLREFELGPQPVPVLHQIGSIGLGLAGDFQMPTRVFHGIALALGHLQPQLSAQIQMRFARNIIVWEPSGDGIPKRTAAAAKSKAPACGASLRSCPSQPHAARSRSPPSRASPQSPTSADQNTAGYRQSSHSHIVKQVADYQFPLFTDHLSLSPPNPRLNANPSANVAKSRKETQATFHLNSHSPLITFQFSIPGVLQSPHSVPQIHQSLHNSSSRRRRSAPDQSDIRRFRRPCAFAHRRCVSSPPRDAPE